MLAAINVGAILGTFTFFAIIAFVVAEMLHLSATIKRILGRLFPSEPTQVDATLDQMYGQGSGTEAEYAATRNARQAQQRRQR